MLHKRFLLLLLFLFVLSPAFAQNKPVAGKDEVYVDDHGVMRWTKDQREAAFFGVNYTVPFAYGYRSVKSRGVDPEEAIRQDVYHFSRLGLDAFRVHVWDTEISDSLGNLRENEHLRLFDFLVAELKKRHIKIIITPIAFWGNGYPDKDENTGSFSAKYGKERALIEEPAFQAQENYLKQFFKHRNQYTGLTWGQDPDVIATEVNNEPHHSGAKERTTAYINRMVQAIRGTGWTKPVFYNISESPAYADAVVKSNVQGHSFQWYPTGLVSGHTLKGNYLPNVSRYVIPFDTIPGFKNRAKMVYEFDAADVISSYMYPAMARSFRAAGFQWATQFAYDPMATAYANTEYQTHYLNLAYTPSKAISLLIAAKAFHLLPRLKNDDVSDTVFGAFRVSYLRELSEMNTAEEFYYSNSTSTKPVNLIKLRHLAGTGSSPVVRFTGSGAYFLDKIEDGVWRLEVMPNAIHTRDPFERTALDKEVTHISWTDGHFQVNLPELAADFSIEGINSGNARKTVAVNHEFSVGPGAWLLVKKGKKAAVNAGSKYGVITLGEFVAPKASAENPAASLADYRDGKINAHPATTSVELFNPKRDQARVSLYNPDWKNNTLTYFPAENPDQLILKLVMKPGEKNHLTGWQSFFADQLKGRPASALSGFKTLVLKARITGADRLKVKIGLIATNAAFFSAELWVSNQFKDLEIPLSSLKQDAQLLLPRPYPGFLPLYYPVTGRHSFLLRDAEKLEVSFGDSGAVSPPALIGLEVQSIYLK